MWYLRKNSPEVPYKPPPLSGNTWPATPERRLLPASEHTAPIAAITERINSCLFVHF